MGSTVIIGVARRMRRTVAKRIAAAEPWAGDIVLADIDRAGAGLVAEEVRTTGINVRPLEVDLADIESIDRLVTAVPDAEYVAIVAGIVTSVSALEIDKPTFSRMLEVNLIGVFFAAQRFARTMIPRGAGSIVAVASISASVPRWYAGAYGAS
jgi:2,3-dihydro-2,3-dihydroxybenzoate dehydrogenase